MNENEFNSRISAELEADQLRRIYDRLEDEATPHAVRVRKGEQHKEIIIYCDANSVAYFNAIIWPK